LNFHLSLLESFTTRSQINPNRIFSERPLTPNSSDQSFPAIMKLACEIVYFGVLDVFRSLSQVPPSSPDEDNTNYCSTT